MSNLEHPDISRTLKTGYPEKEIPVTVCANPDCEEPIYKGDHVWHFGSEMFCQGKCLIKFMNEREKRYETT